MAGHSQTSLGRKSLALTLLQEQILPVSLQWRVKRHWATHHTAKGGELQMKCTKIKINELKKCIESLCDSPAERIWSLIHTYIHTKKPLTCWVQAFCSHSWPATGNPEAPLNWTESPGVAHWPAGMEGAHWTALLLVRQYYPVLGVGVCPPPGLQWLTGEQLLPPLEERNERIGVTGNSTQDCLCLCVISLNISNHVCF